MSDRYYDYRDYQEGHQDGRSDSVREKHEAAYFTGVGYGKKQAGDTHIGFSSAGERASFEHGVKNKDKHYQGVKKELNFWERLFDSFGRAERKVDRKVKRIDKRNAKKEKRKATREYKKLGKEAIKARKKKYKDRWKRGKKK